MPHLFTKLQQIYQKFHLNNLLPFVVLISYTLLGAAIFRGLELDRDQSERDLFRKSYDYAFNQITRRILELRCEDEVIKRSEYLQIHYAEEAVHWFLNYLNFTSIINERNSTSPWTWYGSMFYAGQLYTTIGYGLPVAKTLAGQIASIFYIMFGIPIFLIILKDVGRLLSRSFRKFYKRLRLQHHTSVTHPKQTDTNLRSVYNAAFLPETGEDHTLTPKASLKDDEDINPLLNIKKASRENAFPIPLALALLILWIGLSAALFCLYENEWGYLTSVYFFFVSISTVGLGDIVPSNKDMMLGYFLLILIGLALLSMCINLIQVALERILNQLLQKYIDEIERVAAIAKTEVAEVEAGKPPFEFGMANSLLTVPMVRHQKAMRSIPLRFKDWIAETITNNMISSRLSEQNDEDQSDSDASGSSESSRSREFTVLPRSKSRNQFVDRLREHLPALRTVQALEKTRFYTPNKDFQSVMFNKFITNSKLSRFVDHVSESTSRLVHVGTQTTICSLPNPYLASIEEEFKLSSPKSSTSTDNHKYSYSTNYDAESVFSSSFFDMQFNEDFASPRLDDDSFAASAKTSRRCSTSPTRQEPAESAEPTKQKPAESAEPTKQEPAKSAEPPEPEYGGPTQPKILRIRPSSRNRDGTQSLLVTDQLQLLDKISRRIK